MKVHYTGKQVEITPAIRSRVEQKLQKIHKILGSHLDLEAHVILSLERHRYSTEVTLNLKNHPLVGLSVQHDFRASLQEALEKLEKQAVKYKSRGRERKRRPVAALKKALQTTHSGCSFPPPDCVIWPLDGFVHHHGQGSGSPFGSPTQCNPPAAPRRRIGVWPPFHSGRRAVVGQAESDSPIA